MARFRKYTVRRRPVADINITNLVDVTLVLLIIFIIVAPLLRQGLDIQVPRVQVTDSVGKQSLLVEMDQHGLIALNGDTVALDSLVPRLEEEHAAHPDWPVHLRADGRNTYQNFADLLSAVRSAKIENISLVVEEKQK
ncbi:MAG: biopolymer transporter ExbD [bacterium]